MKTVSLKSQGMTLIEVIVVISIISALALIFLLVLRNQLGKGNDAKRKGDIHKIQVAVEEYEKDNNCYPLPELVTCNPGTGLSPYLNKIPCDPETDASYLYDHEDDSCPSWYRVFAVLEDTDDVDITPGVGPNASFNYYAASPNAPDGDEEVAQGGGGGGGGSGGESGYYGCINFTCTPIAWDPARPGPECDPNYQSPTCYGQCGSPQTQCIAW